MEQKQLFASSQGEESALAVKQNLNESVEMGKIHLCRLNFVYAEEQFNALDYSGCLITLKQIVEQANTINPKVAVNCRLKWDQTQWKLKLAETLFQQNLYSEAKKTFTSIFNEYERLKSNVSGSFLPLEQPPNVLMSCFGSVDVPALTSNAIYIMSRLISICQNEQNLSEGKRILMILITYYKMEDTNAEGQKMINLLNAYLLHMEEQLENEDIGNSQ